MSSRPTSIFENHSTSDKVRDPLFTSTNFETTVVFTGRNNNDSEGGGVLWWAHWCLVDGCSSTALAVFWPWLLMYYSLGWMKQSGPSISTSNKTTASTPNSKPLPLSCRTHTSQVFLFRSLFRSTSS
ncbi:hypothetical protein L6452_11588 [Arctium lappa]|uniref:Uncharacterized protein n=1 Tax=Arctium lappa TaxID=4217 RepID=A0ACB9DPT0_ARCLA|nr:hypothetical protein L6452_11588 [Arctium lappa]